MGWIALTLLIALIVQSIRARNLAHDLWVEKEILKTRETYIKILEEKNKDYNQWLLFGKVTFGGNTDENSSKKN